MRHCYEVGITDKMVALVKFMAEFSNKGKNITEELDFHQDEPIKLKSFIRGPLLTLYVFYPIIILAFIYEYWGNSEKAQIVTQTNHYRNFYSRRRMTYCTRLYNDF